MSPSLGQRGVVSFEIPLANESGANFVGSDPGAWNMLITNTAAAARTLSIAVAGQAGIVASALIAAGGSVLLDSVPIAFLIVSASGADVVVIAWRKH